MDLRRATALAVAVVSACTSAPQPEARPDAPPAVSAPTPAGASAPPAARASLETERSLAASITDATERLQWPSERGEPHVQHTVPLVQHVTLRPAGTDRWEVVGAAGAIPNEVWRRERRHVRVMATEWRSEACVESRQDGSFGPAAVEAGPGMTIYVMPVGQENCTGSATGDGALVLRTPEGVEPGPTMAFAASGAFEGRRWIARGELLGAAPRMTFTVPEPLSRCLAPVIHVHRLFDGDGEFVTGVNSAVHGPVLTPTGLSIETGQGPWGYWARFGSPAGPCLRDGARLSLAGWTSGLLSGWYRPRVALYERGGTLAEEQGRDRKSVV